MGSLINSSNILNSLTNSGMRAKQFARLTYAEKFEFSGGGVALIKSASFSISKLDDAEAVNPDMFRDFSRGYAYGYGYGYAIAGSNQIDHVTVTGGSYAMNGDNHGYHDRTDNLQFIYNSTSSGSDKEKAQDVVRFDYFTIPFDECIQVQHTSSTGFTDIMIYSY